MSKQISKVHILESQLGASKEDFKSCCEREKKLKESNKASEEKVKFLEFEIEDISSRLLVAEQEALHEKANVIRMKEEWRSAVHESITYGGCWLEDRKSFVTSSFYDKRLAAWSYDSAV